MSGIRCNKCDSTNIDTVPTFCNIVCTACGNVLDESIIVEEVQFIRDSCGVRSAVGQFFTFENGFGPGKGGIQNALRLAARLHNYNRTIDDIIKVVKVCQTTLQKKLIELDNSGMFSIEDFMMIDSEDEKDPPSLKRALSKLRELKNEDKLKELESQVTELQKQIGKILENTRKKYVNSKYAELYSANANDNLDLTEIDDSEMVKFFVKPFELTVKDEVCKKFKDDYLEELKEQEERRTLEKTENAVKSTKKERSVKEEGPIQANYTEKVMSEVFQEERGSHKLNYNVLKTLTSNNCLDDVVELEPETDSKSESSLTSAKSVRVRQKVKPAALSTFPLNIKKWMLGIINQSRQKTISTLPESESNSEGPPVKKAKVSESVEHGKNAAKDAFDIDDVTNKKNHERGAVN